MLIEELKAVASALGDRFHDLAALLDGQARNVRSAQPGNAVALVEAQSQRCLLLEHRFDNARAITRQELANLDPAGPTLGGRQRFDVVLRSQFEHDRDLGQLMAIAQSADVCR